MHSLCEYSELAHSATCMAYVVKGRTFCERSLLTPSSSKAHSASPILQRNAAAFRGLDGAWYGCGSQIVTAQKVCLDLAIYVQLTFSILQNFITSLQRLQSDIIRYYSQYSRSLQQFAELRVQPVFFFFNAFCVGWLSWDQFSAVFTESMLIMLALKIRRAWPLRIFWWPIKLLDWENIRVLSRMAVTLAITVQLA
jgi:hypothetical protein